MREPTCYMVGFEDARAMRYESNPAFSTDVRLFETEAQATKAKGTSLLSVAPCFLPKGKVKTAIASNQYQRAAHEANIFNRPYSRLEMHNRG